MTDYKKLLYADGLYLAGFFGCLLSIYIVPPFLDAVSSAFSGWENIPDATIQGIAWTCLIIIWVLATLVVPTGLFVLGLQEEDKNEGMLGTIVGVTIPILWAIFTIFLTYVGRFWLTAFAEAIPSNYPFILALYWVIVAITVIMNTAVVPIYGINKYRG